MNWDKIKIRKNDGEIVDAQAPIIIQLVVLLIFRPFIQIGLFKESKMDMLNGKIHIMVFHYMFHSKIRD